MKSHPSLSANVKNVDKFKKDSVCWICGAPREPNGDVVAGLAGGFMFAGKVARRSQSSNSDAMVHNSDVRKIGVGAVFSINHVPYPVIPRLYSRVLLSKMSAHEGKP